MAECHILQGDSMLLTPKIRGPVNAIITDPPYGMAMKSNFAVTEQGKRFGQKEIENDGDVEAAVGVFVAAVAPIVEVCAEDAEMYVFTSWRDIGLWIEAVNCLNPFEVKNLLVWDKGSPGMGDLEGNWGFSHELIIYAKKGRYALPERRSSVLTFDKTPPGQIIHPTQKPVELMEVLIKMSTRKGDLVVDPFCGSGSTIVAAQRLGRRGLGIELDPEHAERAEGRISQNLMEL